MGILMDGEWLQKNAIAETNNGKFEREASTFRDHIGSDKFPAEAGRYHLYISHACPWCHRTMIMRALKGLEDVISVGVVHPHMGENGWSFQGEGFDDSVSGDGKDPVTGAEFVYQLYQKADPDFTGKATVPVLWDGKTETIVNNESSDIIRMFNSAFDASGADYYPAALQGEIDELNEPIYEHVNNGVYKAGFATTQAAYEEAVEPLFETLDRLEQRLQSRRYLLGDKMTEADIRLFVTLVRFDEVYANHFNCNRQRIADYENLSGFLADIYQTGGVAETVNMDHIKHHYYTSHPHLNPQSIVPVGPGIDLIAPHDRAQLGGAAQDARQSEMALH